MPYMGSQSVTCHPANVTLQPLPQQSCMVLDLATPDGFKAELTSTNNQAAHTVTQWQFKIQCNALPRLTMALPSRRAAATDNKITQELREKPTVKTKIKLRMTWEN